MDVERVQCLLCIPFYKTTHSLEHTHSNTHMQTVLARWKWMNEYVRLWTWVWEWLQSEMDSYVFAHINISNCNRLSSKLIIRQAFAAEYSLWQRLRLVGSISNCATNGNKYVFLEYTQTHILESFIIHIWLEDVTIMIYYNNH